ncbi:cbb3-type cytochrome oxidase assembly protein CcoS [Thiomicrorhabdus chilensis]|uniref:cbb3-type cytochrome oxidase assembly protein CcoS n=1 Tax=Thiomicrorhabdus chilensis TaxID=63656 RepID=UPI00041E4B67|nr:cbb3-type cytochrome oxidase assembly protein CcoS [Thiomicrorhabdus chilensis]
MDVIYGLIPMMLFFGFLVVVVFIWMAKTGHFDDLDGAANRIFMDDEYPEETQPAGRQTSESSNGQNKPEENQASDTEAEKESTQDSANTKP